MGFRINKTEVDRTFANLADRIRQPVRFLKTWGNSVAKSARSNALGKGGRNFWRGVARSVRLQQVSENSVSISGSVEGAHKEYGGEIRAKNKGALTIPIAAEAKGKTAREFEQGGRELFVVNGFKSNPDTIGILGYSPRYGEFHALFVLRKKVTQKADPWFPDEEEVSSLGIKEAAFWLEREARASAR